MNDCQTSLLADFHAFTGAEIDVDVLAPAGIDAHFATVPASASVSFVSPVSDRIIVPKRPLRLSPAREDDAPDPRQALAALNIFANLFDGDPFAESDASLDPRLAASRRRAQRLLATTRDQIAPDEANLWHISVPLGPSASRPSQGSYMALANDAPGLPAPLHLQLARVREALYAVEPDDMLAAAPSSPQMRLASHAMNATLIIVAFPVGAAVTTYSLLRGGDIRVSAQAMAIVAAVVGAWQNGLETLL